jgi:hypothetical protein
MAESRPFSLLSAQKYGAAKEISERSLKKSLREEIKKSSRWFAKVFSMILKVFSMIW